MIYLDHAAMTPPIPVALEAYNNAPFGNPSSEHAVGQAAREALEQAREKIAKLMNCDSDCLYFFSTSSEAASLVLRNMKWDSYEVTASPFEHHAISENIDNDWLWDRPNQGTVIAQMHSNNEVGTIYERPDMKQYDEWFCDATSSVGHVPVNFKELGCSYLVADSIKFSGVPGAAFLIAEKTVGYHIPSLYPLIRGGGQERGMRSGTENVPAICAMAAALEWQTEHMEENTRHVAALRQMLFQILSRIPDHQWNTPFEKPCVTHILNISFDGVDAHALALLLSNQDIMVSPGAACSNGLNEPSHVIMSMFHDEARARSAVRISLSHQNTADEIAEAGQKITEAVAYLRSLS